MENKTRCTEAVCQMQLPRYAQLPGSGLFLEQTCAYIDQCLGVLPGLRLTGSMISNYVKKGLVSSPVRKQYYREQIARLIFIAVAKTVLSMEEIQLVFQRQQRPYPLPQAYDWFCDEWEAAIRHVFGGGPLPPAPAPAQASETQMLRSILFAAAYRLYLTARFTHDHAEAAFLPSPHTKENL